jgi:hypothetical protein
MATQTPGFQTHLQFAHRNSKRAKIEAFFLANLGRRFSSPSLHIEWGSSFRARVSEINLDPAAPITIKNQFFYDQEAGAEVSFYWAELRTPQRHRDE